MKNNDAKQINVTNDVIATVDRAMSSVFPSNDDDNELWFFLRLEMQEGM